MYVTFPQSVFKLPSPKSHIQLDPGTLTVSVKSTVNGTQPSSGLAVKSG